MQWLDSYLIKMKLKFSDILTIVIPAWEYIFYTMIAWVSFLSAKISTRTISSIYLKYLYSPGLAR